MLCHHGKEGMADKTRPFTYRVKFQNVIPPHLSQNLVVYQRSNTQYLVVIWFLHNFLSWRTPYEKFREHEESADVRASHEHRPGEDQDPEERGARAPPALDPRRTWGCHFLPLCAFRGFSLDYVAPDLYRRGGLPQLRRAAQVNHSICKKKKKVFTDIKVRWRFLKRATVPVTFFKRAHP